MIGRAWRNWNKNGSKRRVVKLASKLKELPLLFSLLVLSSTASVVAQTSSHPAAPVERRPPTTTLKAASHLITVPLNVLDPHGAPIPNLTIDDFILTEDGKVQKIAIFERETIAPLSIVLAIDASESVLRDENLERNAAKHFIKALIRPQDELDLIEFSDSVSELVAFTNQPKRIDQGLGQIEHGASTALYDAIFLASQRLGETHPGANDIRRRVIVLITDGTDTVHGVTYTRALEQAQRAGALVYSLIIVPVWADAGRDTGGEHALIQMADDTGGKYYYVYDPRDLEPALRHVSDDLRTQYLVGYYAPTHAGDTAFGAEEEAARDKESRTIAIKLTSPTLAATSDLRYRKTYYPEAR